MIAAQFSDPHNARIIFFAAGGLVVLAIALVVATILWWRSSGIEPAALAPLEVMSTRTWREGDVDARQELVESVRPQPELRVGSPEAGMVVERAQAMSGVSVLTASRPAPVEDPFDDEFDDFVAETAAPESPAAPVAAPSAGLFDQFADDDEPWPAAAQPAPRPSVPNAPVSDEDLWGTPPPAPRRPIDPLINDGDFW